MIVDFLVMAGYSKQSVDEMTFRQLMLFTQVANKRMEAIYSSKKKP